MRRVLPRAELRMVQVNLAVALWLAASLNVPFWRALWQAAGGWDRAWVGEYVSFVLFVFVWIWLVLELLTWGRSARPALMAVLLISAVSAYFLSAYGIAIDAGMIANIVQTDAGESLELVSGALVAWVLGLGGVPILLLSRVRIVREPWPRALLTKTLSLGVALSLLFVAAAPFYRSYAALARNHRGLRLKLVPFNLVSALYGYAVHRRAATGPLEIAPEDVHPFRPAAESGRWSLTLIVIGETARAANFSLYGYPRETNPRLSAEPDVVGFDRVESCGTSTAVSLPCMFLDVGRNGFRDGLVASRENLLDVLRRAGFAVLWLDNNSGCKGVCDRVPHEDTSHLALDALCRGDECYDEVLLHELEQRLERSERDTVVVLHMKGSHGPAYYLRYPAGFEFFTPACRTGDFGRCDRQSIVNAYDNTLRYTDHVLAEAIDLLRRNAARFDATLIYVSDHGESLGEGGIYLHGMPFALAPEEQTHVPMLVWLSQGAERRSGVSPSCLREHRSDALSHDHLYHSILGLLEVRSAEYRKDRDVFLPCRAGSPDASR
jgi:lipid A ethanolaminephosphotransferase